MCKRLNNTKGPEQGLKEEMIAEIFRSNEAQHATVHGAPPLTDWHSLYWLEAGRAVCLK